MDQVEQMWVEGSLLVRFKGSMLTPSTTVDPTNAQYIVAVSRNDGVLRGLPLKRYDPDTTALMEIMRQAQKSEIVIVSNEASLPQLLKRNNLAHTTLIYDSGTIPSLPTAPLKCFEFSPLAGDYVVLATKPARGSTELDSRCVDADEEAEFPDAEPYAMLSGAQERDSDEESGDESEAEEESEDESEVNEVIKVDDRDTVALPKLAAGAPSKPGVATTCAGLINNLDINTVAQGSNKRSFETFYQDDGAGATAKSDIVTGSGKGTGSNESTTTNKTAGPATGASGTGTATHTLSIPYRPAPGSQSATNQTSSQSLSTGEAAATPSDQDNEGAPKSKKQRKSRWLDYVTDPAEWFTEAGGLKGSQTFKRGT